MVFAGKNERARPCGIPEAHHHGGSVRSSLVTALAGLLLVACAAGESVPVENQEPNVTVEDESPQVPTLPAVEASEDVEAPVLTQPFHGLECAEAEGWDATLPCVDGGDCDVVLLEGACGLVTGPPAIGCFAHTENGWVRCADAIAEIEGAPPTDLNERINATMGVVMVERHQMLPQVAACTPYTPSTRPSKPAEFATNGLAFDLEVSHHKACVEQDRPFSWGGALGQGVVTIDIDIDRPGCAEALADLPDGITLVHDENGDGLSTSRLVVTAIASGNLTDLLAR